MENVPVTGGATCPNCKFATEHCHCGYDPNMTYTTTGSTDYLRSSEWVGKATKWDGPVVLSSPQFVEPKPQKCPVCDGRGKYFFSICSAHQEHDNDCRLCKVGSDGPCHGCEGKGWVTV